MRLHKKRLTQCRIFMPVFNPAHKGAGTLINGIATITDIRAISSSVIIPVNRNTSVTNVGVLQVIAKNNGSFTINSTNASDSSNFDYIIIN